MKKAIIIGATGMVGMQLVKQILEYENYKEVIVLGRRSCRINHPKLKEYIVDFDNPESWKNLVKGDVLFSTLGTTLKTAGSKDLQYKVDYTYQYHVAEVAANQGIETYVLVSSAGANLKSSSFYLRMKGELEVAVAALPFKYITILRPGQLDGYRNENRLAEKIGLSVMYALNSIGILKRYQPIQASEVAQVMLAVANLKVSKTYELNELFHFIRK